MKVHVNIPLKIDFINLKIIMHYNPALRKCKYNNCLTTGFKAFFGFFIY